MNKKQLLYLIKEFRSHEINDYNQIRIIEELINLEEDKP